MNLDLLMKMAKSELHKSDQRWNKWENFEKQGAITGTRLMVSEQLGVNWQAVTILRLRTPAFQ